MDGRISDCSQSDSESSHARRFNGAIRHIGPDGLAKIKETIRKQQSKAASEPRENNEDHVGATGGAPLESSGPLRLLHNSNEPIVPHVTDLINGSEKMAKVRKVAVGPAVPSYKGFSETEVKYQLAKYKGSKAQDGARKDRKPRHISLKLQDKRIEALGTWLTVEDTNAKAKKISRVIAPSHRHSKQQQSRPQKNKEIITTSSWRIGQELIKRKLGPTKRSSDKTKEHVHSETKTNCNDSKSPTEKQPETQGADDYLGLGIVGATSAEIQHHKALSEHARSLSNDLHLSEDKGGKGTHSEKEKHYKAPVKRKAPKSSETEKQQQSSAKQRHYDQEQIKKYIKQQRAIRLRQKKQEDMRIKEEEEARKRQLEELYHKQKQVSHVPVITAKKEKPRYVPTMDQMQNVIVSDLPKHHPFHPDRPRFLVSSDSENKENVKGEQSMDVSDSSSTLTGVGSGGDDSPESSPRHTHMDVDDTSYPRPTVNSKDVPVTCKQKHLENNAAAFRTIGNVSFNIDSVMSKFSQALQEKLVEEPHSLAIGGTYNIDNRYNSDQDNYRIDSNQYNAELIWSRAERIQAIKDTAVTLQNRLKEEAKKIQFQAASNRNEHGAATARPSVAQNEISSGDTSKEGEFMSRHELITGVNDDFTVFKSNLPGTQNQYQDIGAHASAQTLLTHNAKLPSGTTNSDIGEEMTMSETSTFSEITLTEESDNEEIIDKKIGAGLKKTGFHIGSLAGSNKLSTTQQPSFPFPTHPASTKASNSWGAPDELNVFSIYSRRLVRPGREPMSKKKLQKSQSEPVVHQYSHPQASTSSSVPKGITNYSQKPTPVPRSRSPGVGVRRIDSQKSESLHNESPVDRLQPSQLLERTSVDEDALGMDSYTQSFESEDKSSARTKNTSEKYIQGHQSLPPSVKTLSKTSDRASPVLESSMDDHISQDKVTPQAERITTTSDTAPAGPPRLSPNSLERKFYMELHNLESMELSIKQLTSVDRTRAVAMAQQETVSLAQMLKAKQQGYEHQMKEIQLKAQIEASGARKQLEDARKRASESASIAADLSAKVREEGVSAFHESPKKLIDTQTEATKATADAVKFLSEARALGLQDANKLGVESTTAPAASAMNAALEMKYPNVRSGKRSSEKTMDQDDLESIGSVDDYSINESMTEDEREEKSFRLILPSESHRKKGQQRHSDNESVTSEASSTRALDHDIHSLFRNKSFDEFTEEMVQQFMKEEDKYVKHQASLLRLRETALMEKTKSELQWLEQQKQRIRNKGADDSYPQIKKLQRNLKIKLQEEQEEIRRLREKSKVAAKERQRKLYEEITKHKAAQTMVKGNTANTEPSKGHPRHSNEVHTEAGHPRRSNEVHTEAGHPRRSNEVHTEAEVSSIDESSDVEKKRKSYKSDSEIYTETKSVARKTKQDSKNLETFKKTHLNEKYLTQRQSRLMDRRKNAKELLKWKNMLDAEEERVFKLEKKALKVWENKDKDIKKDNSLPSQSMATKNDTEKVTSKKDNGTTKNSTIKTISIARDSTAHEDSMYSSIREDIKTASVGDSFPEHSHHRLMNDKSNLKGHEYSESESSVMEDIPSSVEESKKTNDSSDDTMTQSYGNETFEDTATRTTVSKKINKAQLTPKSPLDKLKKMKSHLSPMSPKSLFSTRSLSRNSESESEDSTSHTESQSELSDFEGRILALNEELRWRKAEADKLRRERKKKKQELMKNTEESLKKQIEAYDNQINQLKVELDKEMLNEAPKTTVRPQIKQPKVNPPKVASKKTEAVTPPTKKSTDVTDSSAPETSPVLTAVQDDKDRAQKTLSTASKSSKAASLEKISESSESMTSHSIKSEPTCKERLKSIQDLVSSEASMVEEIEEDISVASEASDEKSAVIKIDLQSKTVEDMYDVTLSITEGFNTDHTMTVHDKLPLSARSLVSVMEPITAQHDKLPSSTRSQQSDHVDPEHILYSSRSEKVSEHISEDLPTVSAESESFVKHLVLKELEEKEHDIFINNNRSELDEESFDERSCSLAESSRPSSGRSERSFPSYQTEHESSESEKSSVHIQNTHANQVQQKTVEKKNQSGLISSNVFDIDDLLGMPDEDDLTPVASPRDLVQEAPGFDSERSKLSNFFDSLNEFNIGDRVSVTGPQCGRVTGKLLFKGNVQFAKGIWAGVELDKPEGRHNGIEDGVRYFTCKTNHGLIVPVHDLLPEIEKQHLESHVNSFKTGDINKKIDSFENGSNVHDQIDIINQADSNVKQFDLPPEPSTSIPEPQKVPNKVKNADKMQKLADKITDHLLESVVKENLNRMSNIAQKQINKKGPPPPVAPKHKFKPKEKETIITNGHIDDLEDFLQAASPKSGKVQPVIKTNDIVSNLMNDAIDHMLDLHKVRHGKDQSRDSGTFEDAEDGHREASVSPSDEIQEVLDKADENEETQQEDTPIRPESPIPGLHSPRESHKPVDSGTFDGEFEDEPWIQGDEVPHAVGVETGTRSGTPRFEQKVLAEDVFYVVPHEEKEISDIVSTAVDEFWEQKHFGEPLTDLQPSKSFYSSEEIGSDLISNSRRVFKKLLFGLTGEVIRNIYKEDHDSPVAWHEPKRKFSKFYKGTNPPTTVQVLKPVVQKAVIDILGLNGARKDVEKNKWGIRKKKDLVDTILVQELREEEPEWIDYDEDELAVKMQLTETIFENLLTDTVQIINKIFRRKQTFLQQKQAAK